MVKRLKAQLVQIKKLGAICQVQIVAFLILCILYYNIMRPRVDVEKLQARNCCPELEHEFWKKLDFQNSMKSGDVSGEKIPTCRTGSS